MSLLCSFVGHKLSARHITPEMSTGRIRITCECARCPNAAIQIRAQCRSEEDFGRISIAINEHNYHTHWGVQERVAASLLKQHKAEGSVTFRGSSL